ncbi:hypothetical protein DWZ97_08745 [Firmicutes bacterium AF36-19BH]|nr:hypothetical protein DWZ97_08745 [Firmicutes bacterium AF36-19BH]
MKRLSWLSVEDYGTTPLEIMVVSTMKGYLRQMPEDEALRKIGEIIEPKVIRLAGEDSAPMPVQSIIEGAKLAAFIDEAVADALRRMEQDKSDVAQIAIEMLRGVDGKHIVETMSPEFVGFVQDAYRSLRYRRK